MNQRLSPLAKRDLDAIFNFLAGYNLDMARAVLARIRTSMGLLMIFPEIGHAGTITGTREWGVKQLPYIIIYRYDRRRNDIEILRVYHGAQDRPYNQILN